MTTATTRWLDDDEMAAWIAYIETVVDLEAALEADLLPHGLTLGDYQVLVYLSEAQDTRCACATSPSASSCRRAASPAASTAWCATGWSSAGRRRPIGG